MRIIEIIQSKGERIMKEKIKTFNTMSLYISLMLTSIVVIGYALGITIICGSLFVLLRSIIMTTVKLIMYLVGGVYRTFVDTRMMTIMIEELV